MVWHWEEELPKHLALKASEFRLRGGRETPLLEGADSMHQDPVEKHCFHTSLSQTYLLVVEGLLGMQAGSCGSRWGQWHWGRQFRAVLVDMSPPGGCLLTWPHPTAYRLQGWDASSQTTKRVGIQPLPSADRLPNVILSPQHLAKHNPWHGPAHQRDKSWWSWTVGPTPHQ